MLEEIKAKQEELIKALKAKKAKEGPKEEDVAMKEGKDGAEQTDELAGRLAKLEAFKEKVKEKRQRAQAKRQREESNETFPKRLKAPIRLMSVAATRGRKTQRKESKEKKRSSPGEDSSAERLFFTRHTCHKSTQKRSNQSTHCGQQAPE